VITNSAGSITTSAVLLSVGLTRLINLSILTSVSAPGDAFTLGYVVGGSGTSGAKPIVIRVVGPSLSAFGVSGTLDDPRFDLFAGSVKLADNDNWGGSATLAAAMSAVGAFPYSGSNSRDAAAALSLGNRDYSVKVSAANNATGAVLAEIYDATPPGRFNVSTPRLVNVSVLKSVGAGFTVGFVVGGSGRQNVLIRAIGPALASVFGVSGATNDPQLTLYAGDNVIATNANWGGGAALSTAFTSAGAFALAPTSRDAAIMATLDPGSYSVRVSAVSGANDGMILAEIYELAP
jgi:hypothetical protein